ncbi:MAG: bifunctional DNA-formamidopyrimidine glycosylase/DNA-(apurinic or apyrimidinic site) lyase [Patescibacteria group bacterium]
MPELPEVETIRRDLEAKIKNKEIVGIAVKKPSVVRGAYKKLIAAMDGQAITAINRRGKLLIAVLRDDRFLLIHLKMTGQLIYEYKQEIIAGGHSFAKTDLDLPGKHTHVIISFRDGSHLYFNDLRQFGYMKIVDKKGLEEELAKFGIEPLTADFTLANFKKIFARRKTSVKALLLNQKLIAGIGNIYADEICFYAGIRPSRTAPTLNNAEIKKLYQGCKIILQKAIKARGTTFNTFRDADGNKGGFIKFLKVYGRKGERCKRCRAGVIIKIKQGGRGTHYCPECQK